MRRRPTTAISPKGAAFAADGPSCTAAKVQEQSTKHNGHVLSRGPGKERHPATEATPGEDGQRRSSKPGNTKVEKDQRQLECEPYEGRR